MGTRKTVNRSSLSSGYPTELERVTGLHGDSSQFQFHSPVHAPFVLYLIIGEFYSAFPPADAPNNRT